MCYLTTTYSRTAVIFIARDDNGKRAPADAVHYRWRDCGDAIIRQIFHCRTISLTQKGWQIFFCFWMTRKRSNMRPRWPMARWRQKYRQEASILKYVSELFLWQLIFMWLSFLSSLRSQLSFNCHYCRYEVQALYAHQIAILRSRNKKVPSTCVT